MAASTFESKSPVSDRRKPTKAQAEKKRRLDSNDLKPHLAEQIIKTLNQLAQPDKWIKKENSFVPNVYGGLDIPECLAKRVSLSDQISFGALLWANHILQIGLSVVRAKYNATKLNNYLPLETYVDRETNSLYLLDISSFLANKRQSYFSMDQLTLNDVVQAGMRSLQYQFNNINNVTLHTESGNPKLRGFEHRRDVTCTIFKHNIRCNLNVGEDYATELFEASAKALGLNTTTFFLGHFSRYRDSDPIPNGVDFDSSHHIIIINLQQFISEYRAEAIEKEEEDFRRLFPKGTGRKTGHLHRGSIALIGHTAVIENLLATIRETLHLISPPVSKAGYNSFFKTRTPLTQPGISEIVADYLTLSDLNLPEEPKKPASSSRCVLM